MEDYTHFTEEALKAQDGKSIPLTAYPGGPVVGEATLHYNAETKTLDAYSDLRVDDPKLAEFLKPELPTVVFRQGE